MPKIKYNSKIYPLFQTKDKNLFKEILKNLEPKFEDKILEVGCGRGFLVKEMQKISPDTVGIDINAKAIENGVTDKLKTMDATKIDFPADYFDKIYSCHTIEHIKGIGDFLKEIERILKPGGKVLFVYPYEIIRGTGAIMASLIMFKNISYCRKIHVHKLNPQKIKKMLQGTKLKHAESSFSFFNTPQYITLLEKI